MQSHSSRLFLQQTRQVAGQAVWRRRGVSCRPEVTHASALTKDDDQHLQEVWPRAARPLCRWLQKMAATPRCRWLPPPVRVTRTSPTSSSLLPTSPLGMRSTVSTYYEICVLILLDMCPDTTLCCPRRLLCAQRQASVPFSLTLCLYWGGDHVTMITHTLSLSPPLSLPYF